MVRSPCALAVVVLASLIISQLILSIDTPSLFKQIQTISDSANATGSRDSWSGTKCGDLSLCTVSSPYMNLAYDSPALSADVSWATSFALISALSLLSCFLLLYTSPLSSASTDIHDSRPSDDPFTLPIQFQRLRIGPTPQSPRPSWLRKAEELQLLHPSPLPAESARQLLRPARLCHYQRTSLESATASLSLSDRPSQTALLDQLGL